MAAVNKQMNPMKVAQTMKDFEQASAKMDMSEELSMLMGISRVKQ